MVAQLEEIVKEIKKDPRNKVFAPESLLLASAEEENGEAMSSEELHRLINDYQEGSLDDDEEEKYDGAVFACSELARLCFGEDPVEEEEEVDFTLSWLVNSDGSSSAEIRPS